MDIDSVRLESSLWIGKKRYRAVLTGWHFNWTELDKNNRDKITISVPVSEVIGAEDGRVEILPQKSVEDADRDFTVFYIKRSRGGGSSGLLWRLGRTQFSCPSRDLRDQWMTNLRSALKTHSPSRPHRLLVFINPFGGKKRARQIYHSLVAPLFELAGISSHVVVTERANQARDHILKKDLTGFDGVVCVGGDGMFSELLHGVIGRTQQEAGLSECDTAVALQPCSLHIGVIPAGSTDCVCFATVGVNDPVTSALHIVIGTMVYLGNRSYRGRVKYLPAEPQLSSPRDNTRCVSGCRVCSESTERLFPHPPDSLYSSHFGQFSNDAEGEWVSVEGRFRCVSLTCMSSSCPRSPLGLSPSAHLADGTGDLIIVRDTHPLSFLTFLHRHTTSQDQFDLPFVEVHRVKAVRFSLPPGEEDDEEDRESDAGTERQCVHDGETRSSSGSQQHLAERGEERGITNNKRRKKNFLCGLCCGRAPSVSVWNCDGEILPYTELLSRVHGQLVRLYARGIEDAAAVQRSWEGNKTCKRRGVLHN
ncbi:ceramide kinase family protein isoform X2 [Osmerus eperlanus]|uniref:ceramide kinase family protein isoform X2 n=1 Tax=Osmerus eperlanus TaxID=29151 RepID=UPI002E135885